MPWSAVEGVLGDTDGAGEPAMVPIAAAISNAVFDQTGQRNRELPIQRRPAVGSHSLPWTEVENERSV